jgi:hypothetical protein
MVAESQVVILVACRTVEMSVLVQVQTEPGCPAVMLVVPVAGNQAGMVVGILVVGAVVAVEGAREPDQVRTWHINAAWEPFQRHNVDKNEGNPGP